MLLAQIADFEGDESPFTTATADLSAVSWMAERFPIGVYAAFAADSYATTHLCLPPGLIPLFVHAERESRGLDIVKQ